MRYCLAIAVVVGTLAGLPAWSQDSGMTAGGDSRTLGGHRFIVSEFVPTPFVTTDFTVMTSLGYGSADLGGTTNQLGALSEAMRLQVAVTDWLAVRGGASGLVLSGIDQDAALNYGAALGYSLLGGATASWRFDRLRVGGSLDLELDRSYNFNILSAINASILATTVDASTLLSTSNTLTVSAGAQVAYGVSSVLGVFGAMQVASVSSSGSASSGDVEAAAGGGVSVDLDPLVHFPIGLLGAYDLLLEFPSDGSASTTSHQLSGGVYYTGAPHLQLGVEVRATLQPNLTILEGVFGMRYFW